ncbi:MAG: MBL fold metallo-hydrolase [Bacteroidales bacterium]|nr:MBL fold metallo-hydrolase [Bacteroidales bacterium]
MFKYLILFLFFSLLHLNSDSQEVKIHYLGHSAFVIQFDNDITVVTDYGKPNAWKEWGWDSPIHNIGDLIPDVMVYSHLHEDHYDSTRIPKGVKHILNNGEGLELKDLNIIPIPTCENQFGIFDNTSYLFTYKEFNILHTGDIQGMIANIENDSVADYFKKNYPENIDLLIMPIEGKIKYIPQAEKFIRLLNPKRVIPTHNWSQEYLDEFITYLEEKNRVHNVYKTLYIGKPVYDLPVFSNDNTIKIILLKKSQYILNYLSL